MGRPPATVDAAFFDNWGPEMAWALGLLYTDGTLRPRVNQVPARLAFSQKSPELLDKLKTLMRSNTRVHHHPRRQYKGRTAGAVFRFEICNTRLCARLLELGLTPRKSLTLRFPDVPVECARHFIRGCWDGDGTVFRSPDGRHLIAKFGCGSQVFVDGMLNTLDREGLPQRRVYRLKRGGVDVNYYYFAFQRPRDIESLFHYLYDGVAEGLYLARKYGMFASYLAERRSGSTLTSDGRRF